MGDKSPKNPVKVTDFRTVRAGPAGSDPAGGMGKHVPQQLNRIIRKVPFHDLGVPSMNDLARLAAIWAGAWKWLALSLLLTVGTAIGMLAVPTFSEQLINQGILAGDETIMVTYGGYMLLAALLAGACQVANTAIAVLFSERTAGYLRTEAYKRIQELSFGNLDRLQPSDLLVRLTTDVQNIRLAIQQGILNLPFGPVVILVALGYIAITSPSLVWLMVAVLVISMVLLILYLTVVVPLFQGRQERYDTMTRSLQENMAGIRVVKAFVRQDLENRRFEEVAGEVRTASARAQHYAALLIPSMIFVVVLALAGVYYFGGIEVMNGTGSSVGEVTAAVQYLFLMIMPFMILGTVLPAVSSARPSLRRVFLVLDQVPDIRDRPEAVTLQKDQVSGRVVFEDVSFGYPGTDGTPGPLVLQNISFSAEAGQTIGVLGPTGSGKTSLVHLIPRFYDVTIGRVTLDGTDVRDITGDSLKSAVGVCLQQPNLFSGTIRENILLGAEDAPDDTMAKAARDADAEGFISSIPGQYDERVARRGANFSGGQRQRLSIARTLAAGPAVLILDDSTSACDVATEARIQEAISRSFPVTRFIVAQRVSSVIAADKILLLDKGRIIASGCHEELLATSPEYREIYDSQLGAGVLPGGGAP